MVEIYRDLVFFWDLHIIRLIHSPGPKPSPASLLVCPVMVAGQRCARIIGRSVWVSIYGTCFVARMRKNSYRAHGTLLHHPVPKSCSQDLKIPVPFRIAHVTSLI
jgi:hypothetical protein